MSGGHGKHANVHFAELAAAARLLLVAIAPFGRGLNRFAIGNFRLLRFDFDLVAPLEPFAKDLQVQFAHAGHHQLFGLRIAVQLHRAVFLDDLVQRAGELAFVAAALGRDGQPTIGVGNLIGGSTSSPSDSPVCRSSILATATISPALAWSIGMRFAALHAQQLVHLDGLARAGDVHAVVLLQRAGENADEAQLLHERDRCAS